VGSISIARQRKQRAVPASGFCGFGFEIFSWKAISSKNQHQRTFAMSMRSASKISMQATLPLHQPAMNSQKTMRKSPAPPATGGASSEIHAYLAARDLLLREAEADTTESHLRRARAANELAESWLRPARSPYEAQSLPEAEAVRERLRCNAVKVRLAQLRTRAGLRRHAA
jgi:hypothetical protein